MLLLPVIKQTQKKEGENEYFNIDLCCNNIDLPGH